MRRNFLAAALVLAAFPAASLAQTRAAAAASADNTTSVNGQARQIDIASGTRVAAELQGALDASKARVGDRVILKTTEALKSGGRTVLKKGASLVGHVADVQRRARGGAVSSLTVIFDRLESGSLSTPISATIDSITQSSARARAGDDELGADARTRSTTSARTSGGSSSSGTSGGGLLGGVTGAVGNTVGGVTGAAGDAIGSTTETVGGAARGVGDTLGRIQITQSAGLSADAGTTLSLAGGNLRLEKGTTFRLTLTESASVGDNR
jgi:hypothetical protein